VVNRRFPEFVATRVAELPAGLADAQA